MAINVTTVTEGDIIESDQSWRINSMEFADHKKLNVGQNFRTVLDKTSPQSIASPQGNEVYYPSENFVEMQGPEVQDGSGLVISGVAVPIATIAAQEGINVRNKNFVVVKVEKTAGYESCPRRVTARESTQDGLIKRQGLTVQFEQVAPFTRDPALFAPDEPPAGTYYVHEVKVVGNVFRYAP